MQIDIVAVGRMKAGPEQELYDRYTDRFARTGKPLHLFGPRLVEIVESRAIDAKSRKSEEAGQLINRLGDDCRFVLLEEHGKDITSHEFADMIMQERDFGTATLAFALGGPDGHGDELRQRAFRKLKFGSLTWPHQIARVMLAEQLYRAATILSGHPYHRV